MKLKINIKYNDFPILNTDINKPRMKRPNCIAVIVQFLLHTNDINFILSCNSFNCSKWKPSSSSMFSQYSATHNPSPRAVDTDTCSVVLPTPHPLLQRRSLVSSQRFHYCSLGIVCGEACTHKVKVFFKTSLVKLWRILIANKEKWWSNAFVLQNLQAWFPEHSTDMQVWVCSSPFYKMHQGGGNSSSFLRQEILLLLQRSGVPLHPQWVS